MGSLQDGRYRNTIRPGITVRIEQKKDQQSGRLTEGTVREILTNSSFHPHGIKVRLASGLVGRVQEITHRKSSDDNEVFTVTSGPRTPSG